MAKTGRNLPCPCGSGRKYKRCCLPKDEAAARSATGDRRLRTVEHGGYQFATSGDVDERTLDMAAGYFERKARGQGPAQQMADFCQPLIDSAGHDPESMNKAMSLGMLFWNMAVLGDEESREEMLNDLMGDAIKLESNEDREEFRELADSMLERHRQMFPELHQQR